MLEKLGFARKNRAPKQPRGRLFHHAGAGWLALKIVISIFLVGITTGSICVTAFAIYVNRYIDPTMDLSFASAQLNYTTVIYYTDANGVDHELQRLHGEQNREWVSYGQIPDNLKKAIVAIEDERFWYHKGVDWKRTLGAFVNLIFGMDSSYGGSTITQQLIKNITQDDDVTVQRKTQEILRALNLEQNMSKDQILELYLNTINLSQGCYGVQTAARLYFGKDVSELDLAECASLAGITNRPSYYDPFNYPENNIKRQKDILWKMRDLGMITETEYNQAKNETLTFSHDADTSSDSDDGEEQSYFVDMVISDVINDLSDQFGYSTQVASRMLYSGGLKIYTTIDPAVQAALESVYTDSDNFPKLAGTTQPQSAMTVMSPTGEILGVVGGRGQKQGKRVLNRALSLRQPGSSIKPLTAYIPALEYGLITPYSVLDDSPVFYVSPSGVLIEDPSKYKGEKKLWPSNYYSGYRGLMTMMKAVEISNNPVPVRLIKALGLERSLNYAADRLGLSTLVASSSGDLNYASLALGGLHKGVSTVELSAAYAALANNGTYTKPRSYTKILTNDNEMLIDNITRTSTAMSAKTAYYMTAMLQNAATVGTGAKARIEGIATAGKTGTTTADKDRWFVGYTPYYVGTVWFGYDTPKEIKGVSGNPALNLWKLVMDRIHQGKAEASFPTPEGLVKARYCLDSGGIPTDLCKADPRGDRTAVGTFFPEDVPSAECTVHVPVYYDGATGMLATPYCPADAVKSESLLNFSREFSVTTNDTPYLAQKYNLPADYVALMNGQTFVWGGNGHTVFCTTHAGPPAEPPPGGGTTTDPSTEPSTQPPPGGGTTTDPGTTDPTTTDPSTGTTGGEDPGTVITGGNRPFQ